MAALSFLARPTLDMPYALTLSRTMHMALTRCMMFPL
jgi:hypothetical protein